MLAFACGADVRNFIDFKPVHTAGVGKDEYVSMGRGDEQMLDKILVARLHAGTALAAAALHTVCRNRRPFHVSTVADRDRDLLVRDQIFQVDFGGFVFDFGPALIAVLFLDFFQFLHDHATQFLFRAENGFVLGDVLACEI